MLRVTTLYAASAVATAAYYTRYLAEAPGEAPGRWLGRQADELGVAGRVEADDLQSASASRLVRRCEVCPRASRLEIHRSAVQEAGSRIQRWSFDG